MLFLEESQIQRHVITIMSRHPDAMAAVAYWATGSPRLTGIVNNPRPDTVRIICDLRSGRCNPAEIRNLMNLKVKVRALNKLHAKVWIGADSFIVGSANASESALLGRKEGSESGNYEAALFVQDRNLRKRAQEWFEELWTKSEKVDERLLALAEIQWELQEQSQARHKRLTLESLAEAERELIEQVVYAAKSQCRRGEFCSELTIRAIQRCELDRGWFVKYARYVGGDPYSARNFFKHRINTRIGKAVKTGVGAEVKRHANGDPVRIPVEKSIIQSYTALQSFDETKITE